MSIALYRKYRPATFGEVRGQEHVTDPLRQALRNGRINHAYLFSGPRGCGKTSSARILARSLNCVSGPTPDPCGQCESCVALAPDGSGSIDVIEIDAASHGGVDDARELRERAFFAPVASRYKVYIIDEAHMVTREGFNALLKLVEEPPPHLKFVFATTEPDKVIGTIRSRTHHYPFRLIPPSTLRELMEEILTEEGVSFDPAALPLVVRAGGGSARDSLSILDQLLAGSGEQGITREGAVALLGYTDSSLLGDMVDALGARDGAATFELIDRIVEGGHDPRRFTADLLERLRDLVVLAAVPDALDKGLINVAPDTVDRMREQAGRIGAAELTRAAELLNDGLTQMRGATAPRLLLELLCARVLLPETATVAAPQHAQPPAASSPPPSQPAPARPEPPRPARPSAAPARQERSQPEPPEPARSGRGPEPSPPGGWSAPRPGGAGTRDEGAPPPADTAGPVDGETVHAAWPRVLEAVKARRRFTWMVLTGNDAQVLGVEGNVLRLGFQRPNDAKGFGNSGSDQVVQAALQEVLGVEMRVVAGPLEGENSPASRAVERPPAPARSPRVADPAEGWPTEPPSADEGPAPPPAADPAPAGAGPDPRPAAPPPDPAAGEPPEPDPSDIADPEDASDTGDAPSLSGFALIQSELGGRVIDEIDHHA